MGWRQGRGSSSAIGLAEQRLGQVSRQWRCPPAPAPEPSAGPDPAVGWEAIAGDSDREPMVTLAPWSRSAVRGLAVIVALAVAVAGYWAWSGRPRAVAVAPAVVAVGTPLPAPTPVPTPVPAAPAPPDRGSPAAGGDAPVASAGPQVVVHVTGLVARPGLVRLPAGARVADAVVEAGGVTRRRAADTVNLARILVDGEQVVVGLPAAPGAAGSAPPGNPMGSGTTPIDLNTATAGVLEGLPGVGPVIAARIVDWRTANGAFRSVEELGEVSGIGDAILAQVRGLVRV